MPEAPAWKFRKLIQDLARQEAAKVILKGRVITGVGPEVIEDGYVSVEGGMITGVGSAESLAESDDPLVDADDPMEVVGTAGTILPGLINSHAHLAWDGIHDLAAPSRLLSFMLA